MLDVVFKNRDKSIMSLNNAYSRKWPRCAIIQSRDIMDVVRRRSERQSELIVIYS